MRKSLARLGVVIAILALGIGIGLALRSEVKEPPTPEQIDESVRAYYREMCKDGC